MKITVRQTLARCPRQNVWGALIWSHNAPTKHGAGQKYRILQSFGSRLDRILVPQPVDPVRCPTFAARPAPGNATLAGGLVTLDRTLDNGAAATDKQIWPVLTVVSSGTS